MCKKILVLLTTIFLFSCGGESQEDLKKLSDSDFLKRYHDIKSINDRGDISNEKALVLHIDTSNTNRVFLFANKFLPVLTDIKKNRPELLDKYNQVWLFADAELTDKFGNASRKGIYAIAYKSEDLKKANLDQLFERAILNLSADVRIYSPTAIPIVRDYCEKDKGAQESPTFCAKSI